LPALLFAPELPVRKFIWLKATIAAGFGMVATPLLGWWALQASSRAT
jgi:hypothetical protein